MASANNFCAALPVSSAFFLRARSFSISSSQAGCLLTLAEEVVGVVASVDSMVSTVSAVPTRPTRLRSDGGFLVSRFRRMDGGGVGILRAGEEWTEDVVVWSSLWCGLDDVFRLVGVEEDDVVEEQSWLQ